MEQCCVCKASSSDIAFQTPAVSIVGDHVTGTETLSICRSCAQKLYDNAIEAINEPKEEHNGVFAICELVLLVGGVLLAIFVKAVFVFGGELGICPAAPRTAPPPARGTKIDPLDQFCRLRAAVPFQSPTLFSIRNTKTAHSQGGFRIWRRVRDLNPSYGSP